ncbi:zinc finger protein 260 [Amyelois transitella]|uniref:zinc finger protein 260 n=1 Tax=Amyelois transitella TaxID=680683 RepID=UPI00067E123C|nr:zinc finger protein 260 [Amyelois transitella]
MDVFRNVVLSRNMKLCFLCFKKNEHLENIFGELYIYEENTNLTSCVYTMMMYLFPSHEIMFEEVCENCTKLILSMYLTLRRYDTKKMMCSIIVDNIINALTKNKEITNQPIKLHIKVPIFDNVNKDKIGIKKCNDNVNSEGLHGAIENICIKNESTICDTCGKVCETPNSLKAHLNCHRQKACPYCSKILKTHSHFKIHVKCHEGIKRVHRKDKSNYYCNDCEYRSLNKCTLQAHINKYHLHIRPFVCQICSKGFYKKSNLTEHAMTHTNAKNLTCEQCGVNFVCRKTLLEHLRLHSGEKPYQCNICKAKFITSGRRSDHFKRKHGTRNECCSICGKIYALVKDLNAHIKRVHAQKVDNPKTHFHQSNYEFLDDTGDVLPVLSSI